MVTGLPDPGGITVKTALNQRFIAVKVGDDLEEITLRVMQTVTDMVSRASRNLVISMDFILGLDDVDQKQEVKLASTIAARFEALGYLVHRSDDQYPQLVYPHPQHGWRTLKEQHPCNRQARTK